MALNNGVSAQLTATTRTGMARFSFPATTQANLIFKLDGSQRGDPATSFTVVSGTEVQGSVTSGNFCGAGKTYTVYFDMQFSQPFRPAARSGGAAAACIRPQARPSRPASSPEPTTPSTTALPRTAEPALTGPRRYLTFDTTGDQTLLAKVGISYVSAANAGPTWPRRTPAGISPRPQSAAHAAWNAAARQDRGSAAAPPPSRPIFYTALYHALLHPNVFSDDNGQYLGVDGTVHTVDPGTRRYYTNFSGWDIYRAQAQLEALVDPAAASDTAQSMVDDYAQDGMLPKWS